MRGIAVTSELKPASLNGQIAVIEASAGARWQEVFYQGARAALVLGSEETSWIDLKDHDLRIPVNFPRFFVPPGRFADDLRAGRITQGTLKARVNWERRLGVNYYALVRPAKAKGEKSARGTPPGCADVQCAVGFDIAGAGFGAGSEPGRANGGGAWRWFAIWRSIRGEGRSWCFSAERTEFSFWERETCSWRSGSPPAGWRDEIQSLDEESSERKARSGPRGRWKNLRSSCRRPWIGSSPIGFSKSSMRISSGCRIRYFGFAMKMKPTGRPGSESR